VRAVVVSRFGDASVLVASDVDPPTPTQGEVVVRVAYAGVNYADTYHRRGVYRRGHTYGVEPPFVPGLEGAGTVSEIGEGVTGLARGDRVAFCLGQKAYAEYVSVPAWKAVKVPDPIGLDVAAAVPVQGATAHYLTHSLRPLEPGDWALVHAAAGGAGRLIVQLAKRRGAHVIATVGDREKAEIARKLGADHVILYRDTPFAPEVRRITAGRGVDVVYDGVGAATIAGSIASLRVRGTCALFGAASGVVEHVTPMELAEAGSIFFTRPHLIHYMRDPQEYRTRLEDVFAAVAAGSLRIAIDRVLPLAQARAAHEALESRKTKGKLLLAADTIT
jgi:NADPH2:quinone reductase